MPIIVQIKKTIIGTIILVVFLTLGLVAPGFAKYEGTKRPTKNFGTKLDVSVFGSAKKKLLSCFEDVCLSLDPSIPYSGQCLDQNKSIMPNYCIIMSSYRECAEFALYSIACEELLNQINK